MYTARISTVKTENPAINAIPTSANPHQTQRVVRPVVISQARRFRHVLDPPAVAGVAPVGEMQPSDARGGTVGNGRRLILQVMRSSHQSARSQMVEAVAAVQSMGVPPLPVGVIRPVLYL